jgi:cellulose synthase/poly-beta-1,6-N-acetylglucosamine synthase-like glycosyltransferase
VVTIGLCAFAWLVYTYVGYPVLVFVLSRLRPLPSATPPAAEAEPFVTVCVPAWNAAPWLATKLDSLLALDYPEQKIEFIVCSDGANDGGDEVVRAYAERDLRVRMLRNPARLGKPTALNRMREAARGEVLLLTDCRQPLEPCTLRALLAELATDVGCVSGNLLISGTHGAGVYWSYENWIRLCEASFRGMVGVTGPIYLLRKEDLAELPPDLILDDVWVPMRLVLAGRKTRFARDAIAYDDAFDDEREFTRKVRTLAGNFQLFFRMPALLLPWRNGLWFETMSHKVTRLLCPLALVLLAAASVFGVVRDAPSLEVLATGQVLFYLLALLGARGGRPGGLARTFVVMHAAVVVGFMRSVTGRQKVTW